MIKKEFTKAHEQLIEEYIRNHPHADWDEAYEKTADQVYDRMKENLAGQADYLRSLTKDK